MINPISAPSIIYTLTTGVKKMWDQMDNRNGDANKLSVSSILMLDPLTTILRLGILKYKSDNTKIGVVDNKVVFYEPTIYQGFSRWWAGDSRKDIQYLNLPILYFACIKHGYVESFFDESDDKENIINRISDMALEGLRTLRKIYNHPNHKIDAITTLLDAYIHILTTKSDNSDFVRDKMSELQNTIKLTYAEFTKEWKESFVKIILKLIDELEEDTESDTYNNNIIGTIDTLLNNMDQQIDKCRS